MTQFLIYAGAFLLVLVTVITVHEFGHFAIGKLSGIKVEEFAIGFGPKIYSRRVGETLYAIRAIPAGGFVRMAGMLGLTGESDAGERNFYRASRPRRFATVAAGIITNFIFGGLIFAIVDMQPTPYQYAKHEPRERPGSGPGTRSSRSTARAIRQDTSTDVTTDLHNATTASQGSPMTVVYRASDGSDHTVTLTPTLTISNIVADQSTRGGRQIACGRPCGDVDQRLPGRLRRPGGSCSAVAPRSRSAATSRTRTARHPGTSPMSRCRGSRTATQPYNAIRAAWIMGVVPGFDGESPPAAIVVRVQRDPGIRLG